MHDNPDTFRVAKASVRHRCRMNWAMAPEERLRVFVELQQHNFDLLKSNLGAYQQFIASNHRRRRHRDGAHLHYLGPGNFEAS